jgi:very-short-patch-repair endonuclease
MPRDDAQRRVLAVARRQHGAITAVQLADAGVGRHCVARLVRAGWLRRLYRGVYLVGPLEAPFTRATAAVLAYGEDALLSHHAAAVLWAVCPPPLPEIDITVRTATGIHSRGPLRAHRCRNLHPHDVTRRHGIPVTAPARTLLDLATQLTRRDLARAVEEAQVLHLVTVASLNEQFDRYPKHRGTAALRKAIRPEPALTRSEAERRFLELIRRARLPEPRTNVRIGGYEVDFYWPDHDLIVEIDGYTFHSSRGAFERDRRRDAELGALGLRVIRVTWRRLVDESEALVANLAVATASGRAGSGTSRRGGGRAGAA